MILDTNSYVEEIIIYICLIHENDTNYRNNTLVWHQPKNKVTVLKPMLTIYVLKPLNILSVLRFVKLHFQEFCVCVIHFKPRQSS